MNIGRNPQAVSFANHDYGTLDEVAYYRGVDPAGADSNPDVAVVRVVARDESGRWMSDWTPVERGPTFWWRP